MGIEVTVRVSGNLEQPDLDAMQKWLEETYPGAWKRTSGPEADGALGTADVVLQVLLENYAWGLGAGTAEVAARLLREQIKARFEKVRDQYPDDDKPELGVETAQPHDDEVGDSASGDEPVK